MATSTWLKATLSSLADAVNPATPSVDNLSVVAFIESFVVQMPHGLKLLFPLGVWIFELSTIFSFGRRFSRLSRTQRQTQVERWIVARFALKREIIRGL